MFGFGRSQKASAGVSTPATDQATAQSIMATRPLLINAGDDEKLRQMKYRLDAIKRYVKQCHDEGRAISDKKMEEFDLEFTRLRAEIAIAERAARENS